MEALEDRITPTVTFRVVSDWGTAFNGEITIRNKGSAEINNWQLGFDWGRQISSTWDSSFVSHAGNHYEIRNAGWNGTIGVGASATFGFGGSPGNVIDEPTNYDVHGASGPGGEVPAIPALSVQANSDGTATGTMNIWYGVNGNRWQLLESGQVIYSASLVLNTPNPQTDSFVITGRTYGAYVYQAVVSNDAGSSRSDEKVFIFGGASTIVLPQADQGRQALAVTLPQGVQEYNLTMLANPNATFRVFTNNATVVNPEMIGGRLRLTALASGRASVRIQENATGTVRYLGVRVRTAAGNLPGLPDYLAVGSVSEDTPGDLNFWRDFTNSAQNKRVDIRYIYLNGGPFSGWRTWTTPDGSRVTSYLRESLKLGMIPYFVWYNIPDSSESYSTDLAHIQNRTYLEAYFRDLAFALEIIQREAADEPVGMVLEPDFLGYLMQQSGRRPQQISAVTSAAYSSGVLNPAVDPVFADNVQGLVQAINYTIATRGPNVNFGWQFDLWASPGIHTGIPATGLIHLTDSRGIVAGRQAIALEAQEIAQYYMDAGITSYGAGFVSIDKYGYDAGGQPGAATDPAHSTWFWNADHWNNYLLFNQVLNQTTGLPVTLWQLPVGHINSSQANNPYHSSGVFPDLPNTNNRYEDSAPTFFFGDSFRTGGNRLGYFSTNQGGDPKVTVSGSQITWAAHWEDARAAGITAVLFGAGVGDSTKGVGSPPTDDYWWISAVQNYYLDPLPLMPPSAPVGGSGSTTVAVLNLLFAQQPPAALPIVPVAEPNQGKTALPKENRIETAFPLEPLAVLTTKVSRAPLQGRVLFPFQEVPNAVIPFPPEVKEAGF